MEMTVGDVLFALVGVFGAVLIYSAVSNFCHALRDNRRQRNEGKRGA